MKVPKNKVVAFFNPIMPAATEKKRKQTPKPRPKRITGICIYANCVAKPKSKPKMSTCVSDEEAIEIDETSADDDEGDENDNGIFQL